MMTTNEINVELEWIKTDIALKRPVDVKKLVGLIEDMKKSHEIEIDKLKEEMELDGQENEEIIDEKNEEIENLQKEVKEKDDRIQELKDSLQNSRSQDIDDLNMEIRRLKEFIASKPSTDAGVNLGISKEKSKRK